MKVVRLAFVFFLAIGLGLFLAVPAEDIPETAFDESETPAYESTPLFSIKVPQEVAPEAQDVRSAADLDLALYLRLPLRAAAARMLLARLTSP